MYELIPPQEEGLPTRPFNSEKDALLWARDEGGLVSSQELQTHAEACPYQPIIAEMEVARSRLGQAGSGDCHVSAVREVESRRLLDFYMAYLLDPTGAWLRVGGLPGTGKTLAVQHSEALLAHALASRGVSARPTFVRLNCAAYSAPKSFLEALAAQLHLTGGTGSFASASSRRMSLGAVREPLTEDALWAKLEERLRSVKRPDMNGRGTGGTLSDVLSSPLIKSMTSWFRGGGAGAATKAAEETTREVSEEQEAAGGDRRLDSSVVKANELVGRTVVLVLDELDQFIATNRETIGCVARLISNVIMVAGSRALLVTVSNTIDDHTALGALWSKVKTGRSPACWIDYAGHDEDRALAAGIGEDKLEPIIFRPFQDAELVQILKVCVGDTFQAPALAMIAKRVTSSRGDARVAVDTCRRALERHVRTLDEKAKTWCPASLMEGEKDNGDKSVEVRDSERQVTAAEANAASKEMDVDVGKDIGKLPQHARFLLLVLLHMTTTRGGGKGGNQVKLADLQNEYTQQAKAILGASQLGASSNFEDNLEWIDENGLVEKGKGGKAKVVSPRVDWATVLPKLTVQDKTHFKALLPK
jgi:Cdc6-like AAA superfamily ATPase